MLITEAEAPRQRAKRLPAEERRRQILDAAVDVFARLGFAAAGTADIAAAAGIGEPTIYRYFSNKRDVYVAAVRGASDEILEHWTQICADAPDALAALQQIGIWYFQRLQQHPELLLLRSRSISDPQDGDITEVVRDAYLEVVRFVEALFQRAQDEGQIAPGEDVKTATWLYMAVGSLLDQVQILGLHEELTTEQVLRIAAMLQPIRGPAS
jgi:AcrR family transcriptional regulator